MSKKPSRWCALLPCSGEESWAVPLNCLAEIVTLHDAPEQPPEQLSWRGRTLPVLDFGRKDKNAWRDCHDCGLVAVFLGLQGEGCKYWGVAVRGEGLLTTDIGREDLDDAPEAAVEHATAAFRLRGTVYQVPDLPGMQKQISQVMQSA